MCRPPVWRLSSITTAKLGKNYKITIFLTDKICLAAIFFMLKFCKTLHIYVVCNLQVAILLTWLFSSVRGKNISLCLSCWATV